MGNYVRYTDDQIEQANSVPIAEILDAQGEQYKRHGSQYKWMRHDSVIFSGSKWYQYSEARGGRVISFCEAFLDMSFQEAVAYLLRDQGMTEGTQTRHESHLPKEETKDQKAQRRLVIPKANATMKCLYRYMINDRGIDPEAIL